MVTTAPVSPNKVGPEALFSSSERDTLPSFDECLSQSFGSIDSIAANLTSSGQNGSGSESANIATLIQMLGDLPARIEGQESAKLDLNSPETVRRGKETDITMPSIDTRLVTPPKSPSRRKISPLSELTGIISNADATPKIAATTHASALGDQQPFSLANYITVGRP
ncbi:hypothetical protein V2A60_004670 [Cordyceps javanica]